MRGSPVKLFPLMWSQAPATPWSEVALPASERAGLLTRASYLAGYSHSGATSPPVRGNAIQLRWLCELPVSPPPDADLSQPMAAPDEGPQTNRMLFETRTAPPACQTCHAALNGFGFGLENYNAAGLYQTTDDGLPVDASGVISGAAAIGRNITEAKRAQAALADVNASLVEALRAKSEFMANMNHELRTPLNGVLGVSSLLADTLLDQEQLEYVEALRVSGESLMAVIEDILDFSKLEAGKLALEREPVQLRALVEEVCSIVAIGHPARAVT